MKRIALYHLETLIWIARLGTFSAAAVRLNTTQPSVSARIQELEGQLGVRLFRREGRRNVLTVQGRDIVRRCETFWTSFEEMLPQPGALTGVVRIGAGEIAAATVLPGYVAKIQSELASITFEIEIDLTANLLQGLLSSKLDIIFLPGPVGGPGLRVVEIGSIDLLWLAGPSCAAKVKSALTARESDVPIWSLPPHSPIHAVMQNAIGGRRDRVVHACNNVQTLIRLIEEGAGVGIVPAPMAAAAINARRLVPIFADRLPSLAVSAAIRERETEAAVLHIFNEAARLKI